MAAELDLAQVLAFVVALAREAGVVVRDTFYSREDLNVEFKDKALEGDAGLADSADAETTTVDLVTRTDKAVEKLIKSRLHEAYPSFLFLGEEEASRFATPRPSSPLFLPFVSFLVLLCCFRDSQRPRVSPNGFWTLTSQR